MDATGTLHFDHVTKSFDAGPPVIARLDLHLSPGAFMSVVGPSGCGKTTMLRLASGLAEPTGGAVLVDTDKIAYVFQDPALLAWRTALKNVELSGELHHTGKAERRRRATEALALVGMAGFEGYRPSQLSGGMRMRVSLARALMVDPRIFLFDEPLGALDEITRLRMQEELQSLFLSQSFTGLYVTHSISEAVFLSTQVAVMSAGPGRIIREIAVPLPFPRRPEIRFQKEFSRICAEVSQALAEGSRP
ncbi:ABC transporter ATP-binding protein [Kitasatospora sp. NPDC048540]|uniref:ABC transporter ATP-binding protein n=1 Tax=unclassified Kitasatospora TaxID=2633591 RepID=UPI00053AF9D6|nr:ABC transporter ATP-binding protein [Kitasatospora sp. MBT63]